MYYVGLDPKSSMCKRHVCLQTPDLLIRLPFALPHPQYALKDYVEH